MKVLFVFVLFFAVVWAQQHQIGFPRNGATVKLGSTIVVEVDRPNSIQGSTEAGMVIAIQSCPSFPCSPPSSILGTILYNGPYDPEFHNSGGFFKPPHQNFSVVIPAPGEFGGPVQVGRAQLAVARFHMIGAGLSPLLAFANITLNIIA
ncbi:hypothetical protein HGRIS_000989 [Hohenbuehelia grisea]|uniref:Uncharacterized protein n=1 Tax=Hohenbuehelia grisea TaxID=104357 RepID=A0ABR3IQD5_9AGAR